MIKSFDLNRVFNKVSHFVQFVSFHPTLIHLSVFVSLTHLSLFLSFRMLPSADMSICLSICPSVWLSLCLDFGTLQTCHTVLSITCFVSVIFLIYNLTTSVIHLLCFDQKVLHWLVKFIHVSLKGFYYIYVCIRNLSSFSSQYHFSLCTSVCLLILIFTVDTQFHAIISFSCKSHEILVLHKFIILQFIFNLL